MNNQSGGKVYRDTCLPDKFVRFLSHAGRSLARANRKSSKRQWQIANAANSEWTKLPPDVREEISKENYYAEVSYFLNASLPFPVVSDSGETVAFWCKVASFYEGMPDLELWQETLSFDHFRRAKKLWNLQLVQDALLPLAKAYDEKLTARDMENLYVDPPQIDPKILELRTRFHEWLWGAAAPLARLNGNRAKAEKLLHEYQEIVEGD